MLISTFGGCGGRCGSDVGEKENIFFAAMEFSKPSKPRVRYTRPWSPCALVKPLNDSGCRENRTNKHSYHLVSRKENFPCT
ncbi:hypothetical protein Hanom_Chr12g01141341 [Helianthus anomalus]